MDKNTDLLVDLKRNLNELFEVNKEIHVTVKKKRSGIVNVKSIITGVYDNFVCVTSNVNGYNEDFTILYNDIMTNNVVIEELLGGVKK